MQRIVKPKTARSKRALQKREPKLEESLKKAIFAKSSTSSANINTALSQLLLLKKPDGIPFSKANKDLHPFEDATSLEFWSMKNDAAFVLVGSHSKKRPNNLVLARMFDHQLLDMLEVGVEMAKPMSDYPTRKPTVGQKPLFHFSGDLFDSHPLYIQFKSMIVDLLHGEINDTIDLQGLEYVISISLSPSSTSNALQPISITGSSSTTALDETPKNLIHLRTYNIKMLKAASRTPFVSLELSGPSFDFSLRRSSEPASERWKQATTLKRKTTVSAEQASAAKRKKKAERNKDVDAMGDKVGRIHVGKQDLSKLQARKMKGLSKTSAPTSSSNVEESVALEGLAGAGEDDGVQDM